MSAQLGPESPESPFGLPAGLVEAMLPVSRAASFPPGAEIFRQSEQCRGAYILRSGRARISICSANGAEVYSRVLGPGSILGLPAVLCGEPYSTTAVALEASELACIDPQHFQEFVRSRPDMSIAIVQVMSRELADMNVRRANLNSCRSCGCPLAETCSHHLYNLK